MIEISNLIPDIAKVLHVQPSTLVFWIFIASQLGRVLARRIPSDATGFWGFMRQTFSIIGFETTNRITADMTSKDILHAAAQTPPIPEIVAAEKTEEPVVPQA